MSDELKVKKVGQTLDAVEEPMMATSDAPQSSSGEEERPPDVIVEN